jgi:hypothetical protein
MSGARWKRSRLKGKRTSCGRSTRMQVSVSRSQICSFLRRQLHSDGESWKQNKTHPNHSPLMACKDGVVPRR